MYSLRHTSFCALRTLMCAIRAVYSYGVILWELFTGHEPWQDKTPMQVRRHQNLALVLCMV